MNEHKMDGTRSTRPTEGKHEFKFLVGIARHTKRHRFKKELLHTERAVTASGMNRQAIRGALHQILVENLDA